ncbi:MAG TPA: hypothetical protein ENF21_01450 [Bacteroidetes bacterium]|nr:hypothetical protein [Bacteroidota bacterium]
MKKTLLALICMVFLLPWDGQKAYGQEEADYKFTLKTNLLAAFAGPIWVTWIVPVTGEYKVLFEAKTFKKQSLQVGASYLGPSVFVSALKNELGDSADVDVGVNGFRGQLWYKFFLTRDSDGPSGFYASPHFSLASARIENKNEPDDYVNATKLNIHGVLGYQLITRGGFVLDIFTGLGFRDMTWDYAQEGSTDLDFGEGKGRINVTFGLSFGYAF